MMMITITMMMNSWIMECEVFIFPDWSPPDNPARPCRPKAGYGLVMMIMMWGWCADLAVQEHEWVSLGASQPDTRPGTAPEKYTRRNQICTFLGNTLQKFRNKRRYQLCTLTGRGPVDWEGPVSWKETSWPNLTEHFSVENMIKNENVCLLPYSQAL